MSEEQTKEDDVKEYLNKYVMPSLLPAVEALLKEVGLKRILYILISLQSYIFNSTILFLEKPEDPESPLNSLHWLASYLLRNNRRKTHS